MSPFFSVPTVGVVGSQCMFTNCDSSPCTAGATCTDFINYYTCTSPSYCTSNPCVHGSCISGTSNYTCNCTASGYTGTNCTTGKFFFYFFLIYFSFFFFQLVNFSPINFHLLISRCLLFCWFKFTQCDVVSDTVHHHGEQHLQFRILLKQHSTAYLHSKWSQCHLGIDYKPLPW